MRPGIHYNLIGFAFGFFLIFHAAVVCPLLYWFGFPFLNVLGLETVMNDQNGPMPSGLVVYWLTHLAILILELAVIAKINAWRGRQTVNCPKCGASMKIIQKTFNPVTTYLCPACNNRRQYKMGGPQGGG